MFLATRNRSQKLKIELHRSTWFESSFFNLIQLFFFLSCFFSNCISRKLVLQNVPISWLGLPCPDDFRMGGCNSFSLSPFEVSSPFNEIVSNTSTTRYLFFANFLPRRCWWGYNLTLYFWILEGPRMAVIVVSPSSCSINFQVRQMWFDSRTFLI